MQKKSLTVLLIEDSPDYATLVQRWLQGQEEDFGITLNWSDTLESGLRRLAQGGVDVVLLDLGLPDSDGPATFAAVKDEAGAVPLIILSAADSETSALRMIQQGAQDYLVKTSCTADLLKRALRYAVVRHHAAAGHESGAGLEGSRIVSVVGSSGGVGTTTVACALAADLYHLTGQPTLLADLDPRFGMVSFIASIAANYSLVDAIRHGSGMDREIWNGIVARSTGELDVLVSPGWIDGGALDPEDVERVFTKVRTFYRWMVLDVGRLHPLAESVVRWSTDVVMVTTGSLANLHQCKRAIESLGDCGVGHAQIALVVNQRDRHSDLSEPDLQNLFGVKVLAALPPAAEDLHRALLQNRLPAVSSDFRKALTGGARKIAGLPERIPGSAHYSFGSMKDRLMRRQPAAPKAVAS